MRQESESTGNVGQNFANAAKIEELRAAVENGNWAATAELATVYLKNDDVEKDGETWNWFQKASDEGNFIATLALGEFRRKAGNVVEAIDFYERAATEFAIVSYCEEALDEGDPAQEAPKSWDFYREAADRGWGETAAQAADIYLNGPAEIADFSRALELLDAALELGYAEAGWTTYRLYQEGRDIGVGRRGALEALESAAASGLGKAAFELYLQYRDDKKKSERALSYLKRAAELGLSEAALELYFLYNEGETKDALETLERATLLGEDKDDFEFYLEHCDEIDGERAAAYLERADELGSENAAYELYRLYDDGIKVDRDVERALAYLERAAKLAHPDAFCEFYRLWRDKMKADEERENRRLDDVDEEDDFDEDWDDDLDECEEAIEYYRRASKLNELDAAFALYRYYREEGDGAAAMKKLKVALGENAETALAELYRADGQIELSDERELACLEQAAKLGASKAAFELYRLYNEGDKVERDVERALGFLTTATALDSREAFFELYRFGRDGVEERRVDAKEAGKYLERSAELGFDEAIFEISRLLRRQARV